MQNKKIKMRFYLAHFIVVIPILVASFLMTYVIFWETMKQNSNVLYQQLNDFTAEFAEMYTDYKERAVLLAGKTELSRKNMTFSSIEAYNGVELLKLSSYFDNSQANIFVSYQTGKIYSITGAARSKVFFRDTIDCTEESIARAEAALEANENLVTLLEQNTAKGYLLFSYKVNSRETVSFNFLVSLEKLEEICIPQFYNEQYYELEMMDGSRVVLESNSDGVVKIRKEGETQSLREKKYKVFEKTLTIPGVTIRLYYNRFSFAMNKWLYTMQAVNVVLLLIGTVLTGLLSWSFTQKRLREIAGLERMAQGDSGAVLPEKNIYSGLQQIISKGRKDNQKLEISVLEHKQKLQNRIAYMIFGGLYSDSEKVTQAFRELGFLRCPESFFVGLVSAQTDSFEERIPEILKDCLRMEVEHEGQKRLLFLYEIETEDGDRLRRRQVAQTIRSQLHQREIRKVRIGMSSVFTDLVLINRAYMEAEDVLEEILSGKRKDFFLCWDEIQNQVSGVFFEGNLLQEFDKAMQEQKYDDAVYCFQKLAKDTASRGCSPRNRTYLRYVILQHIIQYLQQKETTEANIFLKECIHIDVTAEKEFIQTITNVLYQCLNRKEEDAFRKMQEFIGSHYQNSELTYEEVAAAGGISKTYISKVFRAKLDMSYIEYLTAVRMDKACTLLRTTNINISEVAKMVGYANDSSFRRVFKECYGVSASDYRKREKE